MDAATRVPGLPRRRLLAALLFAPPLLAGCTLVDPAPDVPDPLIALADAARADAVLATAAIMATIALTEQLQPLVDARRAHADALDAEVARLGPRPAPPPAPPVPAGAPELADVRQAVRDSALAAAAAVGDLPPDRVGLVAAVAACCSAYGEVL